MRPLLMTKEVRARVETMVHNSALAALAREQGHKVVTTEYTIAEIAMKVSVSAPTLYSWFPGGIRGRAQALKDQARRAAKRRKAA